MTKDQALKLALEALERSVATCFDQYAHQQVMSQPDHFINQAITSLRQAIAELKSQEPVAWMDRHFTCDLYKNKPELDVLPLYTHLQPKREPLTDEQILNLARGHYNPHQRPEISFARAIEAAHGIKEKNT